MQASSAIRDGAQAALRSLERSEVGSGGLALVTVELDREVSPTEVVSASRRAGDHWFSWRPPGDSFELACLGAARTIASRGDARFHDVAARAASTLRSASVDAPVAAPAGAGPLWIAGFAFDPEGGSSPAWSSFEPALAWLPELALASTPGGHFMTVAMAVGLDEPPEGALERVRSRLAGLESRPLAMLDPEPAARTRVVSSAPPESYEAAVEAAVRRIRAGELRKVVLAREVLAEASTAHDPGALIGALTGIFDECFRFLAGTPQGTFLGASPELLVRRRGAGAQTVALAGSARRSADPAVDKHLGERLLTSRKDREEHAIVVERIRRALRPLSVWVESEPEPELARVANIQHLATPVLAQLAEPIPTFELAGHLHPTPAVGGEPHLPAMAAIRQLEGVDRGWYAGAVGWMDSAGDGELCVALRSALLRDRTAHLFAGAGIVADSDPAAELAETELKLDALLPLVSF